MKKNIYNYCNNFDVVIAYGDKAWLSYAFLSLCKRNFKLLFWTIGAPASYDRHYGDARKLHYYLTDFFDKRADGLILYSDVPIQMYKNRGVEKQSFFVANNTVKVRVIEINPLVKNQILFIGSLYLEKGLLVLLEAYKKVYEQNQSIPNLVVVGGGDRLETIKEWVATSKLSSKIELLGPIYDEGKKAELFSKSIACISPLQAG
ncbi:MAG: glycosyltransferase, partial [Bacilli bacterium]|nr:glycosyltransferase [Bacilli bacterium]